MYDVACCDCNATYERYVPMERRHDPCTRCGGQITLVFQPNAQNAYVPFTPYFDIGLGMEITTQAQRWREMRSAGLDYKDHPSRGDLSARRDRIEQQRQESARVQRG